MFSLWRTCKETQTRPSDLLHIPDDDAHAYERFEVDNAVVGLGTYIDAKLEERNDKQERVYKTLSSVLALAERTKPKAQFKRGDLPKPMIKTRAALAAGTRKGRTP